MAVSTQIIRVGCSACKFLRRQSLTKIPRRESAHKYSPVSTDFPNNRFTAVYRDIHGPAVEDPGAARDFIFALKPSERTLLYSELKLFEDPNFGKPGTKGIPPPTRAQLKRIGIHHALPFCGFGFLDNFIMIMAGEYIEATLGLRLGIATMTAAALGNWVSDLAGVWTAHYIESGCNKLGYRAPMLLPEQVDMKQTRLASNMGKAIGISIGCILGMFPLLLMKTKKDEEEEKDEEDTKETDVKPS